eukprot:360129-Chlamydomonas_euryale.AAC.4
MNACYVKVLSGSVAAGHSCKPQACRFQSFRSTHTITCTVLPFLLLPSLFAIVGAVDVVAVVVAVAIIVAVVFKPDTPAHNNRNMHLSTGLVGLDGYDSAHTKVRYHTGTLPHRCVTASGAVYKIGPGAATLCNNV